MTLTGCVIVSGMPGAGKSTVARLVAERLPRGAVVSGDAVNQMVRSGRVGFLGEPVGEALRQDELCMRNMCSLASNFVDYGFTVLMDTVVADRPELDLLVALMAPRPVRLLTLAPGIEVCKHRNAHRDPEDRFEFDGYERLEADMRRDLAGVGWELDTSAMTAEETARLVVAEVADRAAPVEGAWHVRSRSLYDPA